MCVKHTRYASVVSSGKTVSPTASFLSAVLSTMYKEKETQKARNRNFVVYGLQDSPSESDKEHVEKLSETELNLKPDINTCKRPWQNYARQGKTSVGHSSKCSAS